MTDVNMCRCVSQTERVDAVSNERAGVSERQRMSSRQIESMSRINRIVHFYLDRKTVVVERY
jgi:hypothetical protein